MKCGNLVFLMRSWRAKDPFAPRAITINKDIALKKNNNSKYILARSTQRHRETILWNHFQNDFELKSHNNQNQLIRIHLTLNG